MTNAPSARDFRPGMLQLALTVLWSLLYDGIVVRAHHHDVPHVVAAQVRTADVALDDPCPLCDATMGLKAFLLPTFPGWRTPGAATIVEAIVARHYGAPRTHAHGWRSRAPPGSPSLH